MGLETFDDGCALVDGDFGDGSLWVRRRGQQTSGGCKTPRVGCSGVERRLITDALRLEGGNKSAVARRLGISRPTLDAKMEQLKIPRHPA